MRLLGDAAWFGAALLLYLRSLLALHTGAARLILDRLHLLNSKAVGLPGMSQSTVLPPAQVESSVCVMLTGYRFVCGIFPAYLKQVLVLDSVGCQVKWPFRCPSSKKVSGQMVLYWCCSCWAANAEHASNLKQRRYSWRGHLVTQSTRGLCDNAGWPSLSTSEPVVAFKLKFKLRRREAASEKGDPLRFRGSGWLGGWRGFAVCWARLQRGLVPVDREKSAGIRRSSELLPL